MPIWPLVAIYLPTVEAKINIAIDGYSGTGKSSTARNVAARIGYKYLDSGAMYRAVTYYFITHQISPEQKEDVEKGLKGIIISYEPGAESGLFEICLNGENVEGVIRGMEVSERVSVISALPEVREKLVSIQRELAQSRGVVMDGRDIGTVVLPDAELKIFMTADMDIRAMRRQQELQEKGVNVPLQEVIANLEARDHLDTTRAVSPLKKAPDAQEIDTSHLTFEEQVERIVNLARQTSSAQHG